MASTATRIILEPPSERSLVPPGRAGRRDASSSVAPVASGYERGVGGNSIRAGALGSRSSLALVHHAPSAKRNFEEGSKISVSQPTPLLPFPPVCSYMSS